MSTNTGGPAFPNWSDNHYTEQRPRGGMDLRDYFAAKAMQAMVSTDIECGPKQVPIIAESAYILADAMLKAREA